MKNLIGQAFGGDLVAITLVAYNLPATTDFYSNKLGLQCIFIDEMSAVYKCGETLINFLDAGQAPELVAPRKVAPAGTGANAVYTLRVADVDAVVHELTAAGVELLNGPMDRPWGVRTASFADPSGHVWEIANHK